MSLEVSFFERLQSICFVLSTGQPTCAAVDLEMTKIDSLRDEDSEGSGKIVFINNPNRALFKMLEEKREAKKKRASATSGEKGWKGVIARGTIFREEEQKEGNDSFAHKDGGWTEHHDQASGKTYYHHERSGRSQWERPSN